MGYGSWNILGISWDVTRNGLIKYGEPPRRENPSFHAHVNGNIIEPKGFNVAMLPEDTAQVFVHQSSIPAP